MNKRQLEHHFDMIKRHVAFLEAAAKMLKNDDDQFEQSHDIRDIGYSFSKIKEYTEKALKQLSEESK